MILRAGPYHTEEAWKKIEEEAERICPGQGLSAYVHVVLWRELQKYKTEGAPPCERKEIHRYKKEFSISGQAALDLLCVAIRLDTTPANLISRIVFEPLL